MKKILFCVLSALFVHISTASASTFTIKIKNLDNKGIAQAHLMLSYLESNRNIRMGEYLTGDDGSVVLARPTRPGYINIIAKGYEPKRVNFSVSEIYGGEKIILLEPKNTMSILSYNVLEGFKNDAEKKANFIKWVDKLDVDIVMFQEMNSFTDESLIDFAAKYGHRYSVLLKTTGYPTAITSKFPITDIQRIFPNMHHGYIYARIECINLFCIHLSPFKVSTRIAEMDKIITHINSLSKGQPVLVAGDLNSYSQYDATAYGPTFEEDRLAVSNTVVDFTVTNNLIKNGFQDVWSINNTIFKASFPVSATLETNKNKGARYDYIYLNESLIPQCTYADILQEDFTNKTSDHYPVYTRLKRDDGKWKNRSK